MNNPRQFHPPANFRPAGEVIWSRFSNDPPPFIHDTKYRGRRADGVRYERKGQEWLLGRRPLSYVASPWFEFDSTTIASRWCQPDGLDLDIRKGVITIVEFKLAHTEKAWWQLRKLYEPVVRHFFGSDWRYTLLEICKWSDPHVPFPETYRFVPSFEALVIDSFHVHLWDGRF